MEKFGIFELLDTLSALVTGQDAESEQKGAEPTSPSSADSAFAPPDYFGGAAPAAGASEPAQSGGSEKRSPLPPPPATQENPALAALFERHEEVKRRAEGKK